MLNSRKAFLIRHKMELRTKDFNIWYDKSSNVIYFEGSLRLNGDSEYAPVLNLLTQVLELNKGEFNWNVRDLEFLNSSGLNMFYKFVISVRKRGNVTMSVCGNRKVAWQDRSLNNLKKFLPTLKLSVD